MLCLFHDSVGLIRPHISVSVSPTFATRNRPATETSLKAHTCIKRTTSLSPCSPQAFNKNTDNASAGVKMTRHGLTWIKSLSTRQRGGDVKETMSSGLGPPAPVITVKTFTWEKTGRSPQANHRVSHQRKALKLLPSNIYSKATEVK